MSLEFFFRLIGMFLFGTGGVYFGARWSQIADQESTLGAVVFGLVGLLIGLILTPFMSTRPVAAARKQLTQVSARTLFAGIIGLIVGLLIAGLLSFPLSLLAKPYSQVLPIIVAVLTSYLSVTVFVFRQNDFFFMWRSLAKGENADMPGLDATSIARTILLDTSVIIDGRVADIARTGFLAGELLIPRFVLNELQHIADSGDPLRRQRGRRGLDILSTMQKDPLILVRISDVDIEGSRGVDDKLVILGRQMRIPVLTNDYNLNKVAELQGVTILNINELANAVKAVYLPGENLLVRVIQEGREPGQGIGYLDDGTMIVVQDGNEHIGVELDTIVTKILQTAAGRMIFARPITSNNNSNEN